MNAHNERYRKAAILVASLDETAAAALYESLSADEARMLRQAVENLTDINAEEQQAVLAEFLDARAQGSDDVGVELDDNLARRLAGFEHLAPATPPATSSPQAAGFRELAEIDPDALMQALVVEHPQTVAVVLAQLAPARAAEILQRWDAAARHELLDRIATLSPTPPELLREIGQELLARIRAKAEEVDSARHSEARVAAILAAADEPVRLAWHGRQGETTTLDADLGERHVAVPSDEASARTAVQDDEGEAAPLAWDELGRFDDESLATLYASAPAEVVRLALAGADVGMIQRMRRHLGPRAARLLDRQLHRLDAVRISDIVEAQHRLGELAGRLMQEGVLRTL